MKAPFVRQYSFGIFTKLLLHYYYLTTDKQIYNILQYYINAISRYVWNGHRWNYRTQVDGMSSSETTEANFPKLDDALLLTYGTNRSVFKEIYTKAKAGL
jgi:hypothetical protein